MRPFVAESGAEPESAAADMNPTLGPVICKREPNRNLKKKVPNGTFCSGMGS